MKKYFSILLTILFTVNSYAQVRDTLKLTIIKVEKKPADTVYYISSRIDTIALQPVKTDTSKIVKDKNLQDLEESKYRIRFMGSVRVNGYYDFDGMTSTEGFLPYDIPVGEEAIPGLSSVYIGARQSRFGLEGSANTRVGKITTYMEVDFASSTSSFWRLRHAYAEWNYFKMGYTWTTFKDNASIPTTVEFEGPNSATDKKHGLIRYERKYGERSIMGFSIESPKTDYFNPADTLIEDASKQRNFDLAARYKFFNKWGHIQVAGIYRRIDYLHQGSMNTMHGYGILLSSALKLAEKHRLYMQYSMGKGIAYYYVGYSERQLDAVYDPNTDDMKLKSIRGGLIGYSYFYNPSWIISFTAGTLPFRQRRF